jgi:transposase
MRAFAPQHKHSILTHYRAGVRGAGFDALARRFAVAGGGSLIRAWHQRWDGTPASLQEQPRSGRPRILSTAEVSRHVRAPILAANRAHRAVHYTTLQPAVQAKAG